MQLTYNIISQQSTGIYKEKGSKFLSFAIPIQSVEEVKKIVQQYKTEYFDARHICYAYVIGSERDQVRANDDGEPSGTAGKPILGQLNSFELTDILVIVVRYFGGVLLGTGGLITAYKEATIDAINNNLIIQKIVKTHVNIRFDYLLLNDIMSLCKQVNADIVHQNFDNDCEITFTIPYSDKEQVCKRLDTISIHSTIHVHIS